MKEMLKEVRERREGFTMAELLIVVAIVAVLVAIAIPVFTSQLEKSREATDEANLRSAYAECSAAALTNTSTPGVTVTPGANGLVTATKSVTLNQTTNNWENSAEPVIGGVTLKNAITAGTAVTVTVKNDGSAATFDQGGTSIVKTS